MMETPPTTREGLLETAVGVITQPVTTLRRLTRERPLGWALVVAAVLSLLLTVVGVATAPNLPSRFFGLTLVGSAILGPLLGVAGLFIGAGLYHLICLLLGGRGTYLGLVVGFAFAAIPYLLGIPFRILPPFLGSGGQALLDLVQLGLSIWVLALTTIAIRENNGFTTARAVVALLLPLLVIGGLVLLGLLLGAVFLFATLVGSD